MGNSPHVANRRKPQGPLLMHVTSWKGPISCLRCLPSELGEGPKVTQHLAGPSATHIDLTWRPQLGKDAAWVSSRFSPLFF